MTIRSCDLWATSKASPLPIVSKYLFDNRSVAIFDLLPRVLRAFKLFFFGSRWIQQSNPFFDFDVPIFSKSLFPLLQLPPESLTLAWIPLSTFLLFCQDIFYHRVMLKIDWAVVVAQVVARRATHWEVLSLNLHWELGFYLSSATVFLSHSFLITRMSINSSLKEEHLPAMVKWKLKRGKLVSNRNRWVWS